MLILFDAYGTLFDWHGGMAQALAQEGVEVDEAARLAAEIRGVQLQLAWHAALTEAYRDFDRVTRDAVAHVLQGRFEPETLERIARAQDHLPLFPDVAEGLNRLRGEQLAILSNGTLRALQAALSRHGLLFAFDHVVSVDPVRTYKPARRAYQHALQVLKAEKRDVVFVSSNDWDAAAAEHFGFRACHLNRTDGRALPYGRAPHAVIRSMAELPHLLSSIRTP
ncbi:haloacid dehalogenase type II [Alicyclobacillus acidocaldarius]|uniref:Haloacid dehalogenase, type II n=1 Tax=Alicyclobacillus acidocaldarius subsp. acidocaldarius (strain ATCC 27009 / DSM 446 / BCRC 14685 / JCM 5260 / KCTC 1825 / NBRC 15652 / NCIMB 11725 / NRRL B-14509 / 104-IA) TaxID=521098 RepID=C8WY01_ALIAD|nr:haloacid dehalogenase type II [Alicyclobacillus acidocaldarius]ACV58963.1 haloacid dehalogenase, type II [Alicyclobacillus acidocaldarius subsp. acidocaldarius DSM 446]